MKRICLGKIAGAHGIKGLVKIFPYGDDVSLIETLSPLYTGESSTDTLEITLKNPQGKFILAEIKGITDRTDAENIKNTELWVDRDKLPVPDEGEFYYEDLIGLNATDLSGETVGTIKAVHNYGAGDLLEITINGDDILIPFTDDYVPDIILPEGKVIIDRSALSALIPV